MRENPKHSVLSLVEAGRFSEKSLPLQKRLKLYFFGWPRDIRPKKRIGKFEKIRMIGHAGYNEFYSIINYYFW